MKKFKIGLIGVGNRGSLYAQFIHDQHERCELVAAVDFKIDQQLKLIPQKDVEYKFTNTEDFFNSNLELDLLVISSMDKYHYPDALRAIEKGYNLLLEKPIACQWEQVLEISEKAKAKNLKVAVCHVLRYTRFYKEIKQIITEGKLGDIVNINATENVAYWHQCHSYVRGNWHNVSQTAPQILTKCSHDLDIIKWLMDKPVSLVSSFGDLYLFKKENQPKEASSMCYQCSLKDRCDFNAYKFYLNNRDWLAPFIGRDLTDEKIDDFLKTSDYGHCVFDMDNDTVDHQVVNIEFNDHTTASLTMNAFSRHCYRDIKIFGTKGDLIGNFEEKIITVNLFNGESFTIDIEKITNDFSGHGGGDRIMFDELLDYIESGVKTSSLTLLDDSLISHKMAFLAEESRLKKGMPKHIDNE